MGTDPVLVAYSNQSGSTATMAEIIAAALRDAGLAVDCLRAGDVDDVAPYRAVVLGSGVFLPRRRTDGGGFLARHASRLGSRPVWLFCAGPIGRGHTAASDAAPGECPVAAVAQAVGARGWAVLGPVGIGDDADALDHLGTMDHARIRAWAGQIATALVGRPIRHRPMEARCRDRHPTAAHRVAHA